MTNSAKDEMMKAHDAMASVLDVKLAEMPEWKAFRAIDRALLALDILPAKESAAAPQTKMVRVPKHFAPRQLVPGRLAVVKPYVVLAIEALTEIQKPIPTPTLIDFIGKRRPLGDVEKAKVNITSSLSKDSRFKSVAWENGKAWWWADKPVPVNGKDQFFPWKETAGT